MRKWRFRLLAVALSVGAMLLLAEAALRVAGLAYPVFYRPDAIVGTAHVSGADGVQEQEGRAHVRINRDGWRDVDRAYEPRPGTKRVAVLGDSYTSAFQVEQQETFCAVAERSLGGSVEVLNFGVSGYNTAQELLTLEHHVWKYKPHVVLLALFSGNDIAENVEALSGYEHVPYFVREGSALRLDDTFLASPTYRSRATGLGRLVLAAARHSRLAQLAVSLRKASERRHVAAAQPRTFGPDGFWEFGLPNALYIEPPTPAWEEAWLTTEAILAGMRETCRKRHVRFDIVMLSNSAQVHPDRARRDEFCAGLGVRDLLYPERRMAQFCRVRSIPFLALAPELAARAEKEQVFLHGFGADMGTGHWNATGHRWAGERIAAWLRTVGLAE